MSKFFSLVLILTGYLLEAEVAFAETKGEDPLPCLQISSACRKAVKSATQNCLEQILSGNSVPGVSVEKEVIQGCKKIRSRSETK